MSAFYPCNIGGKDYNVKVLHDVTLPDGYTNVDVTLPDYSYKSYGLYVEYNGDELITDVPLIRSGVSSTFIQWTFYDPDDSSNNVKITVTFATTYLRLRIGAVGGNIPLSGTNLTVKFITTDVDIDELLN